MEGLPNHASSGASPIGKTLEVEEAESASQSKACAAWRNTCPEVTPLSSKRLP